MAEAPQRNLVRLLRALQRRHRIRPAASNITSSFWTSIKTPHKLNLHYAIGALPSFQKHYSNDPKTQEKTKQIAANTKHGSETRAIREERSAKLAELYELEMLGRELGLISGGMVGRKPVKG